MGLFGVFLLISAGYSRETWLAPERFAATPGATLRFELMRSESFYGSEGMGPIGAVLTTRGTLAGELASLGPVTGGGQRVSFSATLSRPGLAVVWAEMVPSTSPRSSTLPVDRTSPVILRSAARIERLLLGAPVVGRGGAEVGSLVLENIGGSLASQASIRTDGGARVKSGRRAGREMGWKRRGKGAESLTIGR